MGCGNAQARGGKSRRRPRTAPHWSRFADRHRLFAGGIEWMPVPNWSISIEYDYLGFGTKVVDFRGIGFFPSFSNRVDQRIQAVLVSVNYRFGTWGGH
jgi:hypothetical protein